MDILTSLHGRDCGLGFGDNRPLLAPNFRSGFGYNQIEDVGSPTRTVQWEDFHGAGVAFSTTIPAGPNGWRSRIGSDGACVNWTTTPAVSGTVAGVIGNTTASMAVSGVQLDNGLSWKANQGGLILQARVNLSKITNIAAFIGFTDQTSALEMPIHSAASANTLTTNATDAVGFMFDTSMTDDTWWLTGVANDVDATAQNSGLAPVASTFAVFRIELTAAGIATFFYNGAAVGSGPVSGAVTATVALTPVVAAFNRTTSGAGTVTVDYINVAANRA
jgi:hypothetical protein